MSEESSAPVTYAASLPKRTQWHRILGTFLELLLTAVGITVQSEVQVMSDLPKADIVLLRREGLQWTFQQLQLLCDGLRNTVASHLLIEFKYSESLTLDVLLQALGYYYFYRVAQELTDEELQTFVMLARTPHGKVLKFFDYAVGELPGVYYSTNVAFAKVQIIVLNQLQPTLHNVFVQCFASRRSIYQSAFAQIERLDSEQLSESLWELLGGLSNRRRQKEGIVEKVNQSEILTAEQLINMGKEMRRFVLASISPEERLAGLSIEEQKVLASKMSIEDRLAGLAPEDRLAGLAPEELAKLMAQIEQYLSQQETGK